MISELQAHLRELVAAARDGETIVVCDHRTPVALLTPLEGQGTLRVRKPSLPMSAAARVRTIELPPGVDPVAILDELREDKI
jgi:prevent-host-death family protein